MKASDIEAGPTGSEDGARDQILDWRGLRGNTAPEDGSM